MTTEDIVARVKTDDAYVTSRMLDTLVSEHREGRGKEIHKLLDRYRQHGLPIQTRVTRNPNKIDERIPNDFFSDIVDTKQGYMGNEVVTELDKARYEGREGEYQRESDVLVDFARGNDAVDQNSEMVKTTAVAGVGYRLLYIPTGRSEVRVKLLPPDETVLYEDESLGETQYGMRYWYVDDVTYQGTKSYHTQRTVVEWYDSKVITYYIDDGKGNYILDTGKGVEGKQLHLFDRVPIIKFKNNEEELGEAEKVLALIDAYDTITSATVSEVEQLRLAYLALKDAGGKVDSEFIQLLEQTGIFPLGPDGDAKFITKELSVDGVKIILDELRKNIYEFARSIDLAKDYGGDLRVIGWQVALLNLENSCKVTERKFSMALRDQYQMITDKWREWGVADIDVLDLKFHFTRNFPKDVAAEAKMLLDLLGAVSRKTAYSQVSFIDDVDAEIEAFKAEREESMVLTGLLDERPTGDTEGDRKESADERDEGDTGAGD